MLVQPTVILWKAEYCSANAQLHSSWRWCHLEYLVIGSAVKQQPMRHRAQGTASAQETDDAA